MTQLCDAESNSTLTCDDLEAVVNDNQTATSVLPCMTLLQVEAKTLVSVVLAIGTYSIAMAMRAAKSSGFYNASVRKAMGDFGVAFAIFCTREVGAYWANHAGEFDGADAEEEVFAMREMFGSVLRSM